jgi:hypothetical protein
MNEKAELLVRLLDERYGLTITEDVAREDISPAGPAEQS